MGRSRRSSALLHLRQKDQPVDLGDDHWDDLSRRIRKGKVIPIIGNSVHGDRVFEIHTPEIPGTNDDVPADDPEFVMSVDEQLALLWADKLNYPFPDTNNLARVAQYNLVNSDDAEQAKSRYLDFLKETLLELAQKFDHDAAEVIDELRPQIDIRSFADFAHELDYPRFSSDDEDSLRMLARLNTLPIYVTTSYFDFLERALIAEGRKPRTQVCLWRGNPSDLLPEHKAEKDYVPTTKEPVVYHLHGLERYPTTMVLSEDDYTDFLVSVSQPIDTKNPIIPIYLSSALAESTLLLLGYRLTDWDFRTLFRGIIHAQQRIDSLFSLAIQIKPNPQDGIDDIAAAKSYLEEYFDSSRFKVEWGESHEFVQKLWLEWNKTRHA